MTDEDFISHIQPPRYSAIERERAAARQWATLHTETPACQADACAQGRMVCPTPMGCRLPEGQRTGYPAPRPDSGGRWMMVVIGLLAVLAVGSAIWAGV